MVKTVKSQEPTTPIIYQARMKQSYYQTIRPKLNERIQIAKYSSSHQDWKRLS